LRRTCRIRLAERNARHHRERSRAREPMRFHRVSFLNFTDEMRPSLCQRKPAKPPDGSLAGRLAWISVADAAI
jgi:hypothetical protein